MVSESFQYPAVMDGPLAPKKPTSPTGARLPSGRSAATSATGSALPTRRSVRSDDSVRGCTTRPQPSSVVPKRS